MRDFEYEAPRSLSEAIGLLSRSNGRARPLAGGTDLIDHVRTGRLTPDLIVDLKKIPELGRIEFAADALKIGAAVPCYRIYEDGRICRELRGAGRELPHHRRHADSKSRQRRRQLVQLGPGGRFDPVADRARRGLRDRGTGRLAQGPRGRLLHGAGHERPRSPAKSWSSCDYRSVSRKCGSHYRRFIPRNEMDIAVVGVAADVTSRRAGTKDRRRPHLARRGRAEASLRR